MPHEPVPPVHDELSPSERIALLDACDARLRPVITLALDTGLRRGDLLGLTAENLDGETLRLTVGKTRTPLVLPLSTEARQAIKDLRKLHPNSERLVPMSVTTLRRLFVAAKKRAGISRRLRFHGLRATFATDLLAGNVSTLTVQRALAPTAPPP
jgi:integrase